MLKKCEEPLLDCQSLSPSIRLPDEERQTRQWIFFNLLFIKANKHTFIDLYRNTHTGPALILGAVPGQTATDTGGTGDAVPCSNRLTVADFP